MRQFVRAYGKTLLFFTIVGLIGGFFAGTYLLDSYPENIREQLVAEQNAAGLGDIPTDILLGIISAVQSAAYGLLLGAIGIVIARKIGLWSDDKTITAKPIFMSILVAIIGGLVMIYADILFFGQHSEAIMDSYATKPTIDYIIATVTYGAVIEEVMLRLFLMSLVALILHKLLGGKSEAPSNKVLIFANVVSSLLFAAGHLPSTFILLGSSPLIIARCFLLNGGIGLMFGWLYRKYGLRYSMIAHGGCHVVSKLIWILFI